MAACGPAGENNPVLPNAEFAAFCTEEAECGTDFADNFGQLGLGCERVADHRDIDAARERAFGGASECFFAISQPVAAVNEHEKRRVQSTRSINIDRIARLRAVSKIEKFVSMRAQTCAALGIFRDFLVA